MSSFILKEMMLKLHASSPVTSHRQSLVFYKPHLAPRVLRNKVAQSCDQPNSGVLLLTGRRVSNFCCSKVALLQDTS